jgi:hypothetical protein
MMDLAFVIEGGSDRRWYHDRVQILEPEPDLQVPEIRAKLDIRILGAHSGRSRCSKSCKQSYSL